MLEFDMTIWRSQSDTPPIATKIGTPALLEQLGEECAELGKAALKEARRLRGENPTPVTEAEARANLAEEAADVLNCLVELSRIYFDVDQYGTIRERKVKRWHERLADFFKKKEGKNK
jgi:NTP pyrophosphatase (non-canonical NTP hydrolase)